MELMKWFVLGGALIVAAILFAVFRSGKGLTRLPALSQFATPKAVHPHRRMATIAVWSTIAVVALAEAMVQLMDRSLLLGVLRGPLFWTHLVFAGSFFATLLAIRFRYNGLRYGWTGTHRRLAYLCAALYCGTLATSMWLIIDLPPL